MVRARAYELKPHRNWRPTSLNVGDTLLFVGLNGQYQDSQRYRVLVRKIDLDGKVELVDQVWSEDKGEWLDALIYRTPITDVLAMIEDHILLELSAAESLKDPEG